MVKKQINGCMRRMIRKTKTKEKVVVCETKSRTFEKVFEKLGCKEVKNIHSMAKRRQAKQKGIGIPKRI